MVNKKNITISKINETWMNVYCSEQYMEMDLVDKFSFKVPNSQFHPLVKSGKWDGIKKLYNRKTSRMYVGLLPKLLEFCSKKGLTYSITEDLMPNDESLDFDGMKEIIDMIKPHDKSELIEPYDYQLSAIAHCINMDRSVCLAATSAGKSLIIYCIARIYQMLDDFDNKKIVICVPSISLVEQLYADFDNYSTYPDSKWKIYNNVQKISGKYEKDFRNQIIITTWQSMRKQPHWIYDNIGCIMVDECHTAAADVLTSILESCVNVKYRHGFTGTLDGTECNELVIQGLFGIPKRFVTADQLIKEGKASDIEVRVSVLKHPEESGKKLSKVKLSIPKEFKGKRYQAEVDYINNLQYRNDFLLNMIANIPGNSLVLFDRVESYGKILYEKYKETHPNTFLIIGEVSATDREQIRLCIENHNDAVIFATYQTMQQGVSIKKLNNAFFISSSKSKIRVLQSIGRLMRLHSSKKKAYIFDIVDDLCYKRHTNYGMFQIEERLKHYTSENFKVKFDEYKLKCENPLLDRPSKQIIKK